MSRLSAKDILVECALHVGIGIGRGGATSTPAATRRLYDEDLPRFRRGLRNGVIWEQWRTRTLATCELLGEVAARHARNGKVTVAAMEAGIAEIDRTCTGVRGRPCSQAPES